MFLDIVAHVPGPLNLYLGTHFHVWSGRDQKIQLYLDVAMTVPDPYHRSYDVDIGNSHLSGSLRHIDDVELLVSPLFENSAGSYCRWNFCTVAHENSPRWGSHFPCDDAHFGFGLLGKKAADCTACIAGAGVGGLNPKSEYIFGCASEPAASLSQCTHC
jgi:hypothetical protein